MHEREVLPRSIDLAASFDGLNMPNLACFEYLIRRMQLIEEAHVKCPEAPDYSASEHFMGTGDRPGGALVSPELNRHVAGRLKDESSIQKEKRLAREEKVAQKLTPKGGPKGAGRGGADAGAQSP